MFKNFTWGHGVATALGLFILFILSLIFFFTRSWQNAELVSTNYYQDELMYQEVIDAKNNADALKEQPSYNQTAEGITVEFPSTIALDRNTVEFTLFRTDDAKLDINKQVALKNNLLQIPAAVLIPGSYTLKVQWSQQGKPYQIDYDILWKVR
ncbi:FixH family protein [Planobacterium oryzisoli]|uniref:FixH family protein n=1 Tax=Planobacterium oryzisoli TaxID=2771435 RepID=A0A930YX52_9FLAO|nr:FixH family protein [Planobacterium oryzisoli]MBF5027858.1 FixH family protein [Planobacterium oryzisoli]